MLALFAGGVCIAFAPIFVRLSDTSPAASAFWRVALASLPLWLWVRLSPPPASDTSHPTPWRALLLAGVFFAGDLALWHWSIAFTSVANATLEANFAPIFVALGAWLLFQQRVSRPFIVALCITLGGAILLIGPNIGDRRALIGDALGIGTAVFYAGYMLAVKSAAAHASVARIALVNTVVAALILAPFALATADQFWPQTAYGWSVLIAMALIAHVLGQSLIAFGLGTVPAALGSVVLLIQPLLATVYAWIILDESMGPIQLVGGAIVLLGIYLARRAS